MILNLDDRLVEYVGCITDGISAFDWSPDQELLVVISETKNMLLMSKEFNLINEKSLENQEFGDAKFINVGWGKKETQFHGTEGKDAAKKVAILTDHHFDWDDLQPRISWRTDAEFFLVHIVNEQTQCRKFQVFNREGTLHSTSENVASLESTITWKNSRTLITSSTHRANRHEIVLYERNGLSHGGFTLPFAPKEYRVTGLQWNMDSTLLCICLDRLPNQKTGNSDSQSLAQIWYVNNYHWYLKYSANFSQIDRITVASWDPENALGLHLFLASGKYLKYLFGWTIHGCNPVGDYNGSVAVIDGSDLLITSFKEAIIPPPLCAYKILCHTPINNIIWSSTNLDFLVYTMQRDLIYYKYQTESQIDSKKVVIVSAKPFESDRHKIHSYMGECQLLRYRNIQHINWIDGNLLTIIEIENGDSVLKLYRLCLTASQLILSLENNIKLENIVLNTFYNVKTNSLALQSINGNMYRYKDGSLEAWLVNGEPFRFPQLCSTFATVKSPSASSDDLCIGLTDFYRLYINNKEIANNCTSFFINDKFIILTTHTNSLKFIDFNKTTSLDKLEQTSCVVEECMRRLERGSKIVHCIDSDTACILQMPRGNLEAIHPRILVITQLKQLIDKLEYRPALELMRKHRINMNILYDHSPKLFLDNIEWFIRQIDSVVLLNLFLTELSNDDTTKNLYKNMYEANVGIKQMDDSSDKMNRVCTEMIKALETIDRKRFFLAVLSCHAKTNDLNEALKKIKSMKDDNDTLADDGLRHLLYLADVNQLFDIALGTYDFSIVLMVAEKSQKDPKEYLPFLNELRKLEENYRKYKIDMYLKRYKKALASVAKLDETHHEELLKLVNEQKLFSEALNYFKPEQKMFKVLQRKCIRPIN